MDDDPENRHGARATDSSPSKQQIVDELDALFGEEATPTDDPDAPSSPSTEKVVKEATPPIPPVPDPPEENRPIFSGATFFKEIYDAPEKPAQAETSDVTALAGKTEKSDAVEPIGRNSGGMGRIYALAVSLAVAAVLGGYMILERLQPVLESNDPTDAIPTSREYVEKNIQTIALDLIRMRACAIAWNTRINYAYNNTKDNNTSAIASIPEPIGTFDKKLNGDMFSYTPDM